MRESFVPNPSADRLEFIPKIELERRWPEKLTQETLWPEELPDPEETQILFIRNAKDTREAGENGLLDPEAAQKAKQKFEGIIPNGEVKDKLLTEIESFEKSVNQNPEVGEIEPLAAVEAFIDSLIHFYEIIAKAKEEDRKNLKFLFVASNGALTMPELGEMKTNKSSHMRGMETAEIMMRAAESVLEAFSLAKEQIMNEDQNPFGLSLLKDLRMIEETPKFSQELKEKSNNNLKEFWSNYEEEPEWVTDLLKKYGAEGHKDIARRMIYALKSISQVSEEIHKVEPNSRLFTIAVSHYDSISPLAKSILGMPMENYLKVDYLGGFSVVADQSTRLKAKISGQEYVIK